MKKKMGAVLVVDENIQVKGTTTKKVHVIYSNKEEDEV